RPSGDEARTRGRHPWTGSGRSGGDRPRGTGSAARVELRSPSIYSSLPPHESTMQLSAVEVRILGALVEKEATTPDNYPLSLNALTNACNQTSNRDPVMDLDETAVRNAVNSLRQQSLVRAIQHSGSRVMKFQHLINERLDLDAPALGVMCVLMLRGPQTSGEIRGRTNRLAEFASVADVETVLESLNGRGLVVQLARRPGQKEARYAHLLSGAPPADADDAAEFPTDLVAVARGEDRIASLETAIADLRSELADLRARFEDLARQFE